MLYGLTMIIGLTLGCLLGSYSLRNKLAKAIMVVESLCEDLEQYNPEMKKEKYLLLESLK